MTLASKFRLAGIFCLILGMTLAACARDKEAAIAPNEASPSTASINAPQKPTDTGSPPAFNSARAMQYVKEIVALGPRPIGSANHKKVEDYIHARLKGDDVEDDVFTITATEGKFPVHNVVAKFPGTRDGIIVIASHYKLAAERHFLYRRERRRVDECAAARNRESVARQEAGRL